MLHLPQRLHLEMCPKLPVINTSCCCTESQPDPSASYKHELIQPSLQSVSEDTGGIPGLLHVSPRPRAEQEHRALLGFLKAEVQPGKSQVHCFPCQDRALSSPKAHTPLLDKDGLQCALTGEGLGMAGQQQHTGV